MGGSQEPFEEQRRMAIEELRSRKVGVLIRIIDDLAGMNLSVKEIETILRTCGINDDCAIRFGATMKAEKAGEPDARDIPLHP